ncbi:MAG: outer membrane beta-barrel protein [Bacteroidales bacterium]|nr:outer membrane beta-barrel protein [Bacteroidales bacterium]
MKKLISILAGCLLVTGVSAQTISKGTVLINPTLTNLSFNSVTLSFEGEKTSFSRFGLQATGGYAIIDDLAIIAGLGMQSGSAEGSKANVIDFFAGARYYVIPNLYAGAKILFANASISDNGDLFDAGSTKASTLGAELNAGYSIFLSDRFAFEPSVSYLYGINNKIGDLSCGLSMFSLNFGFLFLL